MKETDYLQSVSKFLKKVPYFAGLDDRALKSVSMAAIPRKYNPEQVVFIEGEPCPGLYVVEQGWFKAIRMGVDGREQVLHMLGPGETINAISVLTGALNQATVIALEESSLWLIPRDQMLRLLDEYPRLARLVIDDLAGRVQHLIQLVEDLSLRSVEARLARLLIDQAEGNLVPRRRWATQAEMASRVGTVPDVLNRALRKLAAQDMIHVSRDQIEILDKDGLTEIAQVLV